MRICRKCNLKKHMLHYEFITARTCNLCKGESELDYGTGKELELNTTYYHVPELPKHDRIEEINGIKYKIYKSKV